MKIHRTGLAFVSGCVAAAALAWAIGDVRAESGTDPVVHVCAASDGVLRLVAPVTPCPVGQRRLLLRKAESDAKSPDEDKEAPSKASGPDAKQLANIDKRLDALEQQEAEGDVGRHVTAPFRVLDRQGRPVLEVDADEYGSTLVLKNQQGKAVARIRAGESGGYFISLSGDRKLGAGFGAGGGSADFRVIDLPADNSMDKARVLLGRDETGGNYRLKFLSPEGNTIAVIGESKRRPVGYVGISDAKGNTRASMGFWETSDAASVAVMNAAGTQPLAELTQGENGGGLLTIFGANREFMVQAGVTAQGFGVVRAGPDGFKPGAGLLGLPGSYIAGKAN